MSVDVITSRNMTNPQRYEQLMKYRPSWRSTVSGPALHQEQRADAAVAKPKTANDSRACITLNRCYGLRLCKT
jgi:hypothetical protein